MIKPHQEMQFLAIYIHVNVKGERERENLRSRSRRGLRDVGSVA